MKIANEERLIIKYSLYLAIALTTVITVLCLFIENFPYTFIICYLLGYLANLVGFLKINYQVYRILNYETNNPQKATFINYLTNYLIYIAVLLISYYFSVYHLIFAFLGLVTIKIIIVAQALFVPKSH